jgi:alpha-methylacyl-CoA racemase
MMLADMGAEVIRVDRKGSTGGSKFDILNRGRRSIAVDLKKPEGVEAVLKLIEKADGLIEGFRPGVMERLGLGPEVAHKRNPKLIFGRMTGWGQDGPMAQAAGHDINYIALTGLLHAIGRADTPPTPPLNLVGDFGGGGMMLAFGLVCAILEARESGKGQIIDAAMTDGASVLGSMMYGFAAAGGWTNDRYANTLDGGAHFYDSYETADGKFIALGSIEPQFYALLLEKSGANDPDFEKQHDKALWPELKKKLAAILKSKTRDEWCDIMEGTDVCFAPVLTFQEAAKHPHNVARNTYIEIEGVSQPAPAPRFSRTSPPTPSAPPKAGQHTEEALSDWGLSGSDIESLRAAEAI